MNPEDPDAGQRFSEISEAYATLGNDDKRRRYDRDVMPRFSRAGSRAGSRSARSGSYAGSRPATGLSKRRGTFRGPPPSFYSRAASNPEEHAQREQEAYHAGFGGAGAAGSFDPRTYASPGAWDPTFNPTPVYKTQTAEDARRNHRRAAEMAAAQAYAEEEGAFWSRFLVVCGIVAFAVSVGTAVNRMSATPKGGLIRGDGTRRADGNGKGAKSEV